MKKTLGTLSAFIGAVSLIASVSGIVGFKLIDTDLWPVFISGFILFASGIWLSGGMDSAERNHHRA